MPELPEVQTTVNGLNKKVLLRTFVDVWSDWEKTVKKPRLPSGQAKSFLQFKSEIMNKKIIKFGGALKTLFLTCLKIILF